MGRSLFVAALAVLPAGCNEDPDVSLAESIPCRVAQRLVTLPGVVPEASGAAYSGEGFAFIWTHNDSGGTPEVYAVSPSGQLVGVVSVRGADNADWEDLAVATCASGSCLYVADIGDNGQEREDAAVYRMREPGPTDGRTEEARKFEFSYPDGARDAEAFFVLPEDRLFVVTKGVEYPISLYQYPGELDRNDRVELELVRQLSVRAVRQEDRVTGAAANREGTRVALRTRHSVLIYDAERLVAGGEVQPVSIDVSTLGEPQGEGITFGPNGSILLTSEGGVEGNPGTLGILWCPDSL